MTSQQRKASLGILKGTEKSKLSADNSSIMLEKDEPIFFENPIYKTFSSKTPEVEMYSFKLDSVQTLNEKKSTRYVVFISYVPFYLLYSKYLPHLFHITLTLTITLKIRLSAKLDNNRLSAKLDRTEESKAKEMNETIGIYICVCMLIYM